MARQYDLLVFFCMLLSSSLAALAPITTLPGWNQPLPSKMYSGYLPAKDPTFHMFSWFVESERDPSTDPVILWVQGGPGASSLSGLLTENGPFYLVGNGHQASKLALNPYRWSQTASVLYWESPPAVGYSYCDGGCPTWNDSSVAELNYDFVCKFFSMFPAFKMQPFYIMGESYAGVYVPMLATKLQASSCGSNLQGIALGNSCSGNGWGTTCGPQNPIYNVEMLHRLNLIDMEHYLAVRRYCKDKKGRFDFRNPNNSCKTAVKTVSSVVGLYNQFNVYDTCPAYQGTFLQETCENGWAKWACKNTSKGSAARRMFTRQQNNGDEGTIPSSSSSSSYDDHHHHDNNNSNNGYNPGATGVFRCDQHLVTGYLQSEDVKTALHADVKWHSQVFRYSLTLNSTNNMVLSLLKQYRMILYSGDVDTNVPYIATEQFIQQLGFPVKVGWKQWHLPAADRHVVGGYSIEYDVPAPGALMYMTFKGSGHMVPHYAPAAALAMVQRFTNTTM
eukprot:TRINITY_DN67476_c1_g1_i1.p1 TRINITY_DN67476_c1_g1~~TRINITY_DN67476_c1_g1_i1.p1  ORF type:complete len:504 (-),score=57.03 TRINITY_DN67476_c1_g1_i1:953-2464(-)